jgi:hypothetical protein
MTKLSELSAKYKGPLSFLPDTSDISSVEYQSSSSINVSLNTVGRHPVAISIVGATYPRDKLTSNLIVG